MCARIVFLSTLFLTSAIQAQTLPTISVTPSSVSFTFQIGSASLPAAQSLAIKRSGSGNALDYTTTITPASPWLIVTPLTGKTGTSISLRVNPSTLTAGTYLATIQFDAQGSIGPTSATVVLIVKNPPPVMTVAPASLAFQWQTDAASPPSSQSFTVSTDGEPFSFSAAAAGGTWLSLSPAVGVVLSGNSIVVTVSIDTTGLVPGTYAGKITVASATASNKSIVVNVTLAVLPGTAVLSSLWPSAAPIGSSDTTITIRGSHLFKASVVKANTTDLTTTWLSTGVMLATVPKAMMLAQADLIITVLNSPQPASNQMTFTVTPPGPLVQTIVNAASFTTSTPTPTIAPGEIVSIFGSSLGPITSIIATPVGNTFPTTLGQPSVFVEFEVNNVWVAAPLIFAQANQINCQTPFSIPIGSGLRMRVTYNNLTSAMFFYDGVAADPGVFTVDSSGRGQAAALNFNTANSGYSLNSAANAAPKGGVLILYLTGTGAINPAPNPEGMLSTSNPIPTLVNQPSVSIGGDAATVISATAVPGALGGLTQLNISVPTTVKAAKDLTVIVTVAGRTAPATATVAVK